MTNDHSQFKQLGFILRYFRWKEKGIFVDCGILDGVRHSNTYDLEWRFGWKGVLIEASPSYMQKAIENRSTENVFINKALYHSTGKKLEFNEVEWSCSPGLSGLVESYNEKHIERINSEAAGYSRNFQVETITLDDALRHAGVTPGFDFLKLDLEGGELNALKGFNISYWQPSLISCEVNYKREGEEIVRLLGHAGFRLLSKRGGDYFFSRFNLKKFARMWVLEKLAMFKRCASIVRLP